MKKIMVGMEGISAKKVLLTALVQMGYDFVEYSSYEDFKFKAELLSAKVIMVVHELNYASYKKEFEFLKQMGGMQIPCILLIDKYDAKVIDDAMGAGLQDIMVMPVKADVIKNKIDSLMNKKSETELSQSTDTVFDISIVDTEIQRANRGNYSLSLVLYELSGASEEETTAYMDALHPWFRETDVQVKCGTNRVLLICPFTIKDDIVEVENKLRKFSKERRSQFEGKVDLWLYGLSYPKDGKDTGELIKLLTDGLKNSMFLGGLKGSFYDLGKSELEQYRSMFKKK